MDEKITEWETARIHVEDSQIFFIGIIDKFSNVKTFARCGFSGVGVELKLGNRRKKIVRSSDPEK
jgi:hypothetical protein